MSYTLAQIIRFVTGTGGQETGTHLLVLLKP